VTGMRIGNAPLSYGAFEMTIGAVPNVPGPDALLAEMTRAQFEGTELGPPGYLGEGGELRARLEQHQLELTGGWCALRFSEPEHWSEDFGELERTLSLFEDAGAANAHPVFGDGGSDARRANPGRGQADPSLGLDDLPWKRFVEGLKRAQALVGDRGFEPTFHPHTSTHVEAPWEIERLLEASDIGLVVDPGHLLVGGTDPSTAVRDWGSRINYVHVKDARMQVVNEIVAEGAGALEAWRRGIFCELGQGDVDLEAFFAELKKANYTGWIVVEQDRIPREDELLSEAVEAQQRNRQWLREHLGI
jgi:inosose dehydratase